MNQRHSSNFVEMRARAVNALPINRAETPSSDLPDARPRRSSSREIRVLLMGDHALMLAALRALIQTHRGIQVVGEIGHSVAELAGVRDRPDVVFIDVDSTGGNGLDTLMEVTRRFQGARMLVLTGTKEPATYHRVIRLGAMGVVFKQQPANVLVKAIEKVHTGELWLERSAMADLLRESSKPACTSGDREEEAKIASLTKREREVVGLVGEGLGSKQLAERLYISEIRLHHHLASIYEKLGVIDLFDLVFYAYRHGLANPPSRPV